MNSLKVALLQILPEENISMNLEKGIYSCKEAKKLGADIALFPEMWSCGYNIPQDHQKLIDLGLSLSLIHI